MAGRTTASRKALIAGILAAVVMLGLLIAVIVLATQEKKDEPCPNPSTQIKEQLTLLDQHSLDDGLAVTWYSGKLSSLTDARNAAKGVPAFIGTEVFDTLGVTSIPTFAENCCVPAYVYL